MDITDSRKFNKFIADNKEGILKILSKRLPVPLNKDDQEDIYQESSIALFEKIDAGNLTKLKCRIKKEGIESDIELPVLDNKANPTLFSYLVEICYRQMLKFTTKKHNRIKIIEMDDESISNEQTLEILNVCSETDNSIYKEILSEGLSTLAKRCRELLGSYYAHKTNWSDIAAKLGIEGGADSAKSAASRCKKTLKERCLEIERKRIW